MTRVILKVTLFLDNLNTGSPHQLGDSVSQRSPELPGRRIEPFLP